MKRQVHGGEEVSVLILEAWPISEVVKKGDFMVKKISIEYCGEWNYYPRAASLAEAIKRELGLDAKLIKSGGGVFEVMANKKLIFSKKEQHRFPEDQEVLESLKSF